jgi:hypothetical protein
MTLKSGFYFTYYFDFRGRIYTDSPVGYTHNKFFRQLYVYGEYTTKELAEWGEKISSKNYEYIDIILTQTDLIGAWPTINFKETIVKYYIHVIFFELGKIFKSKYIVTKNGLFTEKDFIEIGVEVYNNFSSWTLDLDKQLELLSILDIIEDLAAGRYYKVPIFKDATASAIQILILLLGSSTPENYKICNLTDSEI